MLNSVQFITNLQRMVKKIVKYSMCLTKSSLITIFYLGLIERKGFVLTSVVDPDPDPVGTGTFWRIRIRNKQFRIRIRPGPIWNEFDT